MSGLAADSADGLGRKELKRIVGRFQSLRDVRLARIRATLTHEQRSFFDLLPLLWHINHPMLPGFVSLDTPAGMLDFRPDREQLLLARRYVRGFKDERTLRLNHPIRGLYLMGSMGSLGQTIGSDLDFWLCHAGNLDPVQTTALQRKADLLQQHAADIGLHAHFFLMHDESFRHGIVEGLSKESSGHTQHTLLLEEFYRTGLLLAGAPLLWWLVPPEQENNYAGYTRRLVDKRFIRPEHWLDFGGLHTLPAEEFFGVAHWQLFKGIDAPYKSLLKLMLLEAYSAEYPKVDWLCMDTKRAVFGGAKLDAELLDPYLLILQRITAYLQQRGEPDRLQLARRAFYFKAGQSLTRPNAVNDWRHRQMLHQATEWGWTYSDLALLDTRAEWKLDRVMDERNALVSELSRSYRLLTEFAREQDVLADLDTRELALLGRKLYAALDKRPGKIDRVNPGISRDLSERVLWLRRIDASPVLWQLSRHPPQDLQHSPVKTSTSLVEVLTWLHLNGVSERGTRIHYLPKPRGYGEPEPDKILKVLRKRLPRSPGCDGNLAAYAEPARGQLSIWFVNVAFDPLSSHVDAGYQLISSRSDALSFGAAHECLVENIEHLYATTWGEVRIERHADGAGGLLDCLCRFLDLFAPHRQSAAPISAYSFSSTRAAAIADRVARLAHAAADSFARLGADTRFFLRISDRFYLLHHVESRYAWKLIGEEPAFDRYLGESHNCFLPTRIDAISLPDSPLPALLARNERGAIQVFYRVAERGIQLIVFDECGGIYQQWLVNTDDRHLLTQLRRFLDTLASRRMLGGDVAMGPAPSFTRVDRLSSGEWQLSMVRVPPSRVTEHTELTLAIAPSGRLTDGFRLYLGAQEFDSLALGDEVYREVITQLRLLRRGGENYPIYLTGVIGAEDDLSHECGLITLLRLKYEVEQRLLEAMQPARGTAFDEGAMGKSAPRSS